MLDIIKELLHAIFTIPMDVFVVKLKPEVISTEEIKTILWFIGIVGFLMWLAQLGSRP